MTTTTWRAERDAKRLAGEEVARLCDAWLDAMCFGTREDESAARESYAAANDKFRGR